MNADREKAQRMIVQNINGIAGAIKTAVAVKDAFRKNVNELGMGKGTFTGEYLDKQILKAKETFAAQMAAANTDMAKRLEELRILFHDRDAVLDLGDMALTNALALIQTIGGDMPYEQVLKINANFIHAQPELRALRTAYHKHGVVSPGNIDAMIYDADTIIDTLKELAFEGLVQDGSINTFAVKFAKLATLEGMTVETTPDQQGAEAAMRSAAGLPAQGLGEQLNAGTGVRVNSGPQ